MGIVGSAALAPRASANEGKACYHKDCGKTADGERGICGTKDPNITDQKSCAAAGGVWITDANAKTFQKTKDERE